MLDIWLKFENEFICWKRKRNFCLHLDMFICLCMLVEELGGYFSLTTQKVGESNDVGSVTSKFLSNKKGYILKTSLKRVLGSQATNNFECAF